MTRYKYKFWLDDQREGDHEIAAIIETLKGQRAYTQAIRDGLRLIADLKAGNTGVLLELFPAVGQQIGAPDTGAGSGGNDDKLTNILSLLQQQMTPLPAPPPNYPVMKESAGKPTPVVTERKLSKAELKAMNAGVLDSVLSDLML